jgi:hypothetical protein
MTETWKTKRIEKFNKSKRFVSQHIEDAKKLSIAGNFIEAEKHLNTSMELINKLKEELHIPPKLKK